MKQLLGKRNPESLTEAERYRAALSQRRAMRYSVSLALRSANRAIKMVEMIAPYPGKTAHVEDMKSQRERIREVYNELNEVL